MTKYLLDTGVAGDFVNHRHGIFEEVKRTRARGFSVGIGVPVLAELAFGIERSVTREANLRLLQLSLDTLKIWPFDKDAAFEFGRLHAELRRNGRPMQIIDIMIAAIAKTMGNCVVVTKDSDFEAISGLALANWAN